MKNTLFMLVIGLFFGTGFGFLLGQSAPPADLGHDHSAHGAPHDDDGPIVMDTPVTGHDHSALIDAGTPAPTLTLTAHSECNGGLNIQIQPTDFTFSPDLVNTEHRPGEGHAHIYINGVKTLRAYGPWVHVSGLPPGPTDVRVTLNANSHEQLATDGAPIEASIKVTVK